MADIVKATVIFVVVSLCSFLLLLFRPSSIFMIQMLSLGTFILFFILKLLRFKPLQTFHIKRYRWVLLFLTILFISISLLSTGGIYSPLISLVSLTLVGISFFFSFNISVLYLITILLVLSAHVMYYPFVLEQFLQNPGLTLANTASMILILPIAYLLSTKYHTKETLTHVMENQIKVEETILSRVNDLVFVIDKSSIILSINDSAERILRKSKSHLLYKPLFDFLLVKNSVGNILNIQSIPLQTILEKNEQQVFENVTIFASNFPENEKVDMIIKPIHNLIDTESQLIVIISQQNKQQQNMLTSHEDTAMTRLNAVIESLKKELRNTNPDYAARLQFIAKAEKEILLSREIAEGITASNVLVDLAQLCKEVTHMEEELAQALKVQMNFSIADVTDLDMSGSSSTGFPVAPDELTSQFYSAYCDVKYVRLAIEKLVDVALYIAADSQSPDVHVQVNREGANRVVIQISAQSPEIPAGNEQDCFKPYYGSLSSQPHLSSASGLEGSIGYMICSTLKIPLRVSMDKTTTRLVFKLEFTSSQASK